MNKTSLLLLQLLLCLCHVPLSAELSRPQEAGENPYFMLWLLLLLTMMRCLLPSACR
jgi:hypothetical protein